MQKILDAVGNHGELHEVLENYEMFKSVAQPSQFAVIKIGGALLDSAQQKLIAEHMTALHEVGLYPTIVHGAGPQLDKRFMELGIDTPKDSGKRFTPKSTSSVLMHRPYGVGSSFCMDVNSGTRPNPSTGAHIAESIAPWWGVLAGTLSDPENIASVDTIKVDTKPITTAIYNRIIPVVSNVGKLLDNEESYLPESDTWDPWRPPNSIKTFEPININADTAACLIAAKLGVKKYVSLTEVGGIMNSNGDIMSELYVEDIPEMIDSGVISDGAIPKAQEAAELVKLGIGSVAITNPQSMLIELLTNKGNGTLIK